MGKSRPRFSLIIVGRTGEISAISGCCRSPALQVFGVPTDISVESRFDFGAMVRPLCVLPLCHDFLDHIDEATTNLGPDSILFPQREPARLETDRIFAFEMAKEVGLPTARSHILKAQDALDVVSRCKVPIVLKNPQCPAADGLSTAVFNTRATARAYLLRLPKNAKVFLQEHISGLEISHTAFVTNGRITPLVTSREFKVVSSTDGEFLMPPVAGISEMDLADRHGLVKQLLSPLSRWLKAVEYRGFLQVSAILARDGYRIIEFNVRLGVTVGPLLLQQVKEPCRFLESIAFGDCVDVDVSDGRQWGCSLTPVHLHADQSTARSSPLETFFGFGKTRKIACESAKLKLHGTDDSNSPQIPNDFFVWVNEEGP